MAQQPAVNYFLPPAIQFGAGAVENLAEHLLGFGGKKPLIVTDEGVTNAGILSQTVEPLSKAKIDFEFSMLFNQIRQTSVFSKGWRCIKPKAATW